MTPSNAAKDALRAQLAAVRRARPAAELAGARHLVRAHVLELVGALGVRCVAGYEPLRTEPGSLELLADLHARAVRVLVPHTQPDRDLDWREWSPSSAGALLGASAIGDAELVLVPALAVARDGTRLGRGGGSYDRALPRRDPTASVWALLFDDEVVDALPREAWDVPVHGVVTPTGGSVRLRNTGGESMG